MTRVRLHWLGVVGVLTLAGCQEPPPAGDEEPDITGIVTAVHRSGDEEQLGVIRVETVPEDGSGTPKASVTITRGTTIDGAHAPDVEQAFGEVHEGARVHVWFTGPVMESYPLQATAGRVELESSAPER